MPCIQWNRCRAAKTVNVHLGSISNFITNIWVWVIYYDSEQIFINALLSLLQLILSTLENSKIITSLAKNFMKTAVYFSLQ